MIRLIAPMVLLVWLCGCDTMGLGVARLEPFEATSLPALQVDSRIAADPEVAAAIKAYDGGHPDVASALINRALQARPRDAELHYVNGQIYLGWGAAGFPQYQELAGTAFQLALEADPTFVPAARQLGGFLAGQGRYRSAVVALAHAVNQDPYNAADLRTLARVAYLAEQPTIAKWALDRAMSADVSARQSPDVLALTALVDASIGRDDAAVQQALQRYQAAAGDPAAVRQITRAVGAWQTVRALNGPAIAAVPGSAMPAPPASTPAATIVPAPPPGVSPPPVIPPPPPPPPIPGTTPLIQQQIPPPSAAPSGPPMSARWDACDPPPASSDSTLNNQINASDEQSNYSQNLTVINESNTGDRSTLQALPSPCANLPPPRMALIDVVVIRVSGITSEQFGVNLLDQLQATFTGSISSNSVRQTGLQNVTTTTILSGIGLPTGGITYSLNIANAFTTRNEVVARPTLVALDRRQSTYFSGQALVAGISGGTYSGSSFIEIPAGVSLATTPTFVDDDTLLLSVHATRSFFDERLNVDLDDAFDQQIATSRNSVLASVMMRMGDTLILSGLVERQLDRQSSKVPGLGDIPGPNVAFSDRTTTETNNSVLILLTPRRANDDNPTDAANLGFRPGEATAYLAMLDSEVRRAGLDPTHDQALATRLDAASRAVLFPGALLLPPPDRTPSPPTAIN